MKKVIIIICVCYLQFGCSKDSSNNSGTSVADNPSIVNLLFPFQNSLCNVGTNITLNESTVLFEWEASDNTDSYTLIIKNLATGVLSTHESVTNALAIVIARGTPFEWYVISKSGSVSTTAKSSAWKFYNATDGVQSYTPFPAEIVSPKMAETISTTDTRISLDWNGSDIDDDIVSYDVYFGTTTTPSIFSAGRIVSTLNNVPIASNTIYYWKVITRDSKGNSSDSGVFQFKIK